MATDYFSKSDEQQLRQQKSKMESMCMITLCILVPELFPSGIEGQLCIQTPHVQHKTEGAMCLTSLPLYLCVVYLRQEFPVGMSSQDIYNLKDRIQQV